MGEKPQTSNDNTAILLDMWITRALAVAAAVTSLALSVAGPARADQIMQGVYTYTQGDIVTKWTIYPSCVPTVGDLRDNLELPVACRLHVTASSPRVASGDARLTGGLWTYTTNIKDGLQCSDGSTAPIQEIYKFDDVSMTGTRSVINNDVCDGEVAAKIVNSAFTLAYVEPLPIPVQPYPLYCEPGGLKRCF